MGNFTWNNYCCCGIQYSTIGMEMTKLAEWRGIIDVAMKKCKDPAPNLVHVVETCLAIGPSNYALAI